MRGIPAVAPDRAKSVLCCTRVMFARYVWVTTWWRPTRRRMPPGDDSPMVMVAALTLVRLGEVFKVTVTARTERFIKIL